jgi:hypothetical protein
MKKQTFFIYFVTWDSKTKHMGVVTITPTIENVTFARFFHVLKL